MDHRHAYSALSRRQWLRQSALGFGSLAFTGLAAHGLEANPLAPKAPHHPARAKRVIFLFMQGGPSQMDLFDYKPKLKELSGQPLPFQLPSNYEAPGLQKTKLMAPISPFRHAGQSGLYLSEWLPEMATIADELCVLRAVHVDAEAHAPAVRQMHTGHTVQVRPAMGSWVLYGLGTENQNMPGYITLRQAVTGDAGSPRNFSSAFLPVVYQGTPVGSPDPADPPIIRHTARPDADASAQRRQLNFIQALNEDHLTRQGHDANMRGMMQAYELAFRMQVEAPGLMDLAKESKATLDAYGVNEPDTRDIGTQCLLARRLVEAGVRFVQVNDGGWDHHASIRSGLPKKCRNVDKPVTALIRDLKQRGLLNDTLVIWGGEFGRTPFDQDLSLGVDGEQTRGREHNPHGFTMWMAGGGVKPGIVYGQTDEFGYHGVEGKIHLHDLHATILHLLGLDHERLTHRYAGRDFRLTDVYGRVVREILA
ncbi:MAG: DUF1501 domain-containing protein [Acidobacteriota bacterium]